MADEQRIFVTGAAGQLGGLVVDSLLTKCPAAAIVAGARNTGSDAAEALRAKGVEVRADDYTRPDLLAEAFGGIDRLLLVSSSENGKRTTQHRNVISAAKAAGVELIAYTSILHADTSPLFLAEEHLDTEEALAESGVPFVVLRNGWYSEVYTWRLPTALELGVLVGAAGMGRISAAARADYAEAAAVVVSTAGHAGKVYELAGDESFTLADLAAVATAASGRPIPYSDLAPGAFKTQLLKGGAPEFVAKLLSDTDAGVAKGALLDDGRALSKLIGRPTTPFAETITTWIRSQNQGTSTSAV